MAQAAHLACGSVAALVQQGGEYGLAWLSPVEAQRLAGITAPRRRVQFLAGRWLARLTLAARHGGAPAEWQLSAPTDGPPQVIGAPVTEACNIGLSHSGDTVACVVADDALGIDVERHDRRELNLSRLTEAVLNDAERTRWLAGPIELRASSFLAWWTLKEAWVKAHRRSLNLAALPSIEAMPIEASATRTSDANARLWREADFTLALVGLGVDAPLYLATSAPGSEPQWWRVTACTRLPITQ